MKKKAAGSAKNKRGRKGVRGIRRKALPIPARRPVPSNGVTEPDNVDGPSPAWLRMMENKRHRQTELLAQPTRERKAIVERRFVVDPVVMAHHPKNCPGCIMPGYVETTGWPKPCRIRVTDNIECRDTASAQQDGHHYKCTYWEHFPDETPF